MKVFQEKPYQLLLGDCRERLKDIPTNTVDAVVTDPPYELGFMGKSWDASGIAYSVEMWKEVLRVMKPGAHILAFSGTRTYHRMVVAMEDAGFEIRDQLQWIYGSGFPKSLDVSKAVDKCFGKKGVVVKEITGPKPGNHGGSGSYGHGEDRSIREPESDLAKQWKGWGTALKPANEPIVLARKPLEKDSVAKNVLKWGTGGINVDAGRIEVSDADRAEVLAKANKKPTSNNIVKGFGNNTHQAGDWSMSKGRFPANVLFDEEAARMLDEQSGILKIGELKGYVIPGASNNGHLSGKAAREIRVSTASSGGASRFFYTAKTSKWERNFGLTSEAVTTDDGRNKPIDNPYLRGETERKNHHPTVKPFTLMRYLVKLITPPGGVVLDPFLGSGTTGAVSVACGFKFIGIEMTPEYMEIAKGRIGSVKLNEVID